MINFRDASGSKPTGPPECDPSFQDVVSCVESLNNKANDRGSPTWILVGRIGTSMLDVAQISGPKPFTQEEGKKRKEACVRWLLLLVQDIKKQMGCAGQISFQIHSERGLGQSTW